MIAQTPEDPDATASNSSTGPDSKDCGTAAAPTTEGQRMITAEQMPFVLRAWWLREFREYQDLVWRDERYITGPVWSMYSDPGCDMSGLDYAYDLQDD